MSKEKDRIVRDAVLNYIRDNVVINEQCIFEKFNRAFGEGAVSHAINTLQQQGKIVLDDNPVADEWKVAA